MENRTAEVAEKREMHVMILHPCGIQEDKTLMGFLEIICAFRIQTVPI